MATAITLEKEKLNRYQDSFYKRCEENDMYKRDFEESRDRSSFTSYEKSKERFIKASFNQQTALEQYQKQIVL